MAETDKKLEDAAVLETLPDAGVNLPTVTESSQRVFLHSNPNSVSIIIILSDDFNRIANENKIGIEPDFDSFREMNINPIVGNWYVDDRRFETGRATFKNPVRAVKFEFKGSLDLDEIVCKGVEATLMPMLDEVEVGMEAELDAEIARLRTLKRQQPKRS